MYFLGGIVSGMMMFNVFRKVFEIAARKATGWEDPETPEYQVK